jgi:hypothetical protein
MRKSTSHPYSSSVCVSNHDQSCLINVFSQKTYGNDVIKHNDMNMRETTSLMFNSKNKLFSWHVL